MQYREISMEQEEWDEMISHFSDVNLLQSWTYGETKKTSLYKKISRAIFTEENEVLGAVQSTVYTFGRFLPRLVWINRGPLWMKNSNKDISQFIKILKTLKEYWVDQQGCYMRIAPAISNDACNQKIFENLGFRPIEQEGWGTSVIDLTDDLSVIRAKMNENWRRHLKKFEKETIQIEVSSSDVMIKKFCKDYARFLKERKISTMITPQWIEKMHRNKGKLEVSYAFRQGDFLGAILMAHYAKSAEYMAGISFEEGRDANITKYLFWDAMKRLQQEKYENFDVGGMHPTLTPPGIYRFKKGLNGKEFLNANALECIPDSGAWKYLFQHVRKVK